MTEMPETAAPSRKGVIAFAVALGGVIAWGLSSYKDWLAVRPAQSDTRITIQGIANNDPTRFAVAVENTGGRASRVRRDFTLTAADPSLIEFGPLTLLSEDERRVVGKGSTAILELEIAYIRTPGRDVRTEAFWRQYGSSVVTLSGYVEESTGEVKPVADTEPLSELREFIEWRADRPKVMR